MRVMKVPIFALVALILPPSASTQVLQQPAHVGIVAGLDQAKLTLPTSLGANSFGFLAGLYYCSPLSPTWSIETEALIVQKGSKARSDGRDFGAFRINYAEFPVLARYQFRMDAETPGPHVYVGPAVAVQLSCHFSGIPDDVPLESDCGFFGYGADRSNGPKRIDYGIMGGVGISTGPVTQPVAIDLRYDFGLSNLDQTTASRYGSVSNRVISLAVSVGIR